MTNLRPSVRATYDSRKTGEPYWVTVAINDETRAFQHPIPDPFVRQVVSIGWRTLLRALLLRRHMYVEVTVGGDVERMNDVLELDENALIHGRTRKEAFRQSMHEKLRSFGEGI